MSNKTATVQRSTLTRDAVGGSIETWASDAVYQMALQPTSGSEDDRYGREEYTITHRGYLAGTPDILPDDRLSIDGNTYLIRAVLNPCGLDRYTKLLMEQEI